MNRPTLLKELEALYKKLKKNEDFKTALHTLKLIAQLQGCFDKVKEFDIKNLSDEDLNSLILRFEKGGSHGL